MLALGRSAREESDGLVEVVVRDGTGLDLDRDCEEGELMIECEIVDLEDSEESEDNGQGDVPPINLVLKEITFHLKFSSQL